MAANTHISIASWNLALDAALNVLNGGTVKIYSGSQPATPDVAITSQTMLVSLPLSATAFAAASAGSKVANAITAAVVAATGTAAWFRAFKSDGTTAVLDGSVGASAADITLTSTALTVGVTVSITGWTVSMSAGQ